MTFIKTEGGRVLALGPGQIRHVEFAELPKIQRERPVLTLHSAAPGAVAIDYLTKGLSSAPSYRVDLSDAKNAEHFSEDDHPQRIQRSERR